MIINKFFKLYCVAFAGYLFVINLYFISLNGGNSWSGYSDQFYVFLFAMFLMIGCSMIDAHFYAASLIRFPDRKKALLIHFVYEAIFTFAAVSVLFLGLLLGSWIFQGIGSGYDTKFVIGQYFRILLATILLANLSLFFAHSKIWVLQKSPHFSAFLILAGELLIVRKGLNNNFGFRNPTIFFSWMYADYPAVCYSVLLGLNIVVLFLLYNQCGKKDWL